MIAAVLSGFAFALIAPYIHQFAKKIAGWVIALLPASLCAYFISQLLVVAETGEPIIVSLPWIAQLNISLSFYGDGFSLLFASIISGIGTLIVIYASGYLHGNAELNRFYAIILIFMASMLGVVLSNNVITLFIFWELTSISSYLLIGFDHRRESAREAAKQALLVTGIGGLALLAGMILMGLELASATGQSLPVFEISAILNSGDALRESSLYIPILILVLAGAFTKSAQFPFQFWLPSAMEGPTPVSAYLHSATMVKAGVYILARFLPVLGGTEIWLYTLTAFGGVTMLLGAYIAWQQTDLKRILAYATVSALGTLVFLIGIGTPIAIKAAVVFLMVHSFYKGGLFMIAGAVDHETGTRDINILGGLRGKMPIIFAATILAALSMGGWPPMIGFIGKEVLYEATLEEHNLGTILSAAAVAANMLMGTAALILLILPFFGKLKETPKKPHEAPPSMWLGPVVLGTLGLVTGLLPELAHGLFGDFIVAPAVSGILLKESEVSLHLIPTSFSNVVLLSIITLVGGVAIYFGRHAIRSVTKYLDPIENIGPAKWYKWTLDGVLWFADWQSRVLQNGYLRYYILTIVATTVILVGETEILLVPLNRFFPPFDNLNPLAIVVVLLIPVALIMIVTTRSRLAAVAALGVVGYSVALIFVIFSAPDLAMTQFSIETLTVILLVLILYRLPRFVSFASRSDRIRDAIVSLAGGALMTSLVLVINTISPESVLAPYFGQNSYTEALGHNVVNVILVDFRGIDTMGEITMLAVAALGVFALLKLRLGDKDHDLEVKPGLEKSSVVDPNGNARVSDEAHTPEQGPESEKESEKQ